MNLVRDNACLLRIGYLFSFICESRSSRLENGGEGECRPNIELLTIGTKSIERLGINLYTLWKQLSEIFTNFLFEMYFPFQIEEGDHLKLTSEMGSEISPLNYILLCWIFFWFYIVLIAFFLVRDHINWNYYESLTKII